MNKWRLEALCALPFYDPEWWFTSDVEERKMAKAICKTCPVRAECSLAADEFEHGVAESSYAGIWGGEDEMDRAQRRGGTLQEALNLYLGVRCNKDVHLLGEVGVYVTASGAEMCRGCLSDAGRAGAEKSNQQRG